MRSWMIRVVCGLVMGCGGFVGESQACTDLLSATVGPVPLTTSAFVPTIVSSSAAISIAAPVVTHGSGFGVVAVPQAVVVPQAVTVQQFAVPQLLQQQVVRQRVRITTVPRLGVRALFCR